MDSLEHRILRVEEKLDEMNKRINAINAELSRRIDETNARIDAINVNSAKD